MCLLLMAAMLFAAPSPARAWGFDAHMFIMERAITLLPAGLRPLFERYRATAVEHSIDPDTWRSFYEREGSNHFMNLDWEGHGPYPFAGLPRDYDAAVAKFGKERVEANGTLPWRVVEVHANLRNAFAAYKNRGAFGRFDILLQSAALAHYVSDAHVPLHAVLDSDGRATNQRGIHTRFEAILFERYRGRLRVAPVRRAPIGEPRDMVFDALIAGTQLVRPLLDADAQAIGTRDIYDDVYYAALFKGAGTILERRVNESIAAVAAAIAGAWDAAGKPPLPLGIPEPPQRRRR